MTKQIFLSDIDFKASPKVRYTIEKDTVLQYAEAYQTKKKMPPIVLFWDSKESRMYLGDGAHRCEATRMIGRKSIEAEVKTGTYTDCLQYALLANTVHGLPRSPDDKVQCIMAAVKEWPTLSNVQLAKLTDVDDKTVAKYRKELEAKKEVVKTVTRTASDGKQRAAAAPRNSEVAPKPKVKAAPPAEVVVKDALGYPIPKKVQKFWERQGEIISETKQLSAIINAFKGHQQAKDILYAEINFSGLLADLEKAWHNMRLAIPYAVCTVCAGHPETQSNGCRFCFGKGLISKFRYDTCAPKESKQMREAK
jgi:hypothetical protein